MKSRAFFLLVLLAGLWAAGCQHGRSFMTIDSDSRMPFFGMQLVPRREKSEEKPARSIAQTTPAPRPQPLGRADEQTQRAGWLWGTTANEPQRIPLPRTDLGEAE